MAALSITPVSQRTAFIGGGTGSLGTAMVQQFKNLGWNVAATYRKEEDGERLRSMGVQAIRADVTDYAGLDKAVTGLGTIDAAVFNAGILSAEDEAEFNAVNVYGADNFYRILAGQGKLPKNVIHVSSQLVGGPDAQSQKVEERYQPGGLNSVSSYARSKARGEYGAVALFETHHMKYELREDPKNPGNGKMLFRGTNGQTLDEARAEARQGIVSLRPAGIMGARDMVTTKPMVSGLRGLVIGGLHLGGFYPNVTYGDIPEISVISEDDMAYVAAYVATEQQNRIDRGEAPRFGIYDVENGEGPITPDEIVAVAKEVLDTPRVWTPKLPVLQVSAFLNEEVAKRLVKARKMAQASQRVWEERRKNHEDVYSTQGELLDRIYGFMGGSWKLVASAFDKAVGLFAQVRTVDYSRVPELSHPKLATSNARLYADFPGLNPVNSRRNFERFKDIARKVKDAWKLS